MFDNCSAVGLRHDYLFSSSDLKELSKVLLTVSPGPRLMVIKTLVNSWSTSKRMHESVIHPCLFCGDGEDDLAHYLICDVLWTVISTSANLNSWQILIPPLERVCIVSPTKGNCILIACAFLVYHAVKLQHLDVALNAIASKDPTPIVDLSLRLAEIHLKDLLFGQVIVLKAPFFSPEVEKSHIWSPKRSQSGPNGSQSVQNSAPSCKNCTRSCQKDRNLPMLLESPAGPFQEVQGASIFEAQNVPIGAQSVSNVGPNVPNGSRSAPNGVVSGLELSI